MLTREETRELLDAIETDDIAGLRDRALIGLLVFSFARIGALLRQPPSPRLPPSQRPYGGQVGGHELRRAGPAESLSLKVGLSTEARRAKADDYFPEGKRWKLRLWR